MSDPLTPTAGARFLLERISGADETGSHASYRAAIFTPTETVEGRAELADDGSVTLAMPGDPQYVSELEKLAKLTARSAAKKRSDGLPPWPARVLRWRGPGRGA